MKMKSSILTSSDLKIIENHSKKHLTDGVELKNGDEQVASAEPFQTAMDSVGQKKL